MEIEHVSAPENNSEISTQDAVENTMKESSSNSKYKVIEPKAKLSFDDRMAIIQSFNEGFIQPNYSVKKLNNGNYKITRKTQDTLPQSLISASNASSIKMSNEMLMFEHVLDLSRKYDKLHTSYKKLKRKYNDSQPVVEHKEPNVVERKEPPVVEINEDIKEEVKPTKNNVNIQQIPWRTALFNSRH